MNRPMLANFIAFQLGWLACVMLAAQQRPVLAAAAALLPVVLFLALSRQPMIDLGLVLAVGLVGGLWDSLLTALGIFQFSSGLLAPVIAPHWIMAMWLLFATTLNVSLRWLHGRYLLAMVLGGIAGPLAYQGGAALGAVDIHDNLFAGIVLVTGWALLMPLLVRIAREFDYRKTPLEAG